MESLRELQSCAAVTQSSLQVTAEEDRRDGPRLHGRDDYDGTGIGLSICRKVVARHCGEIWVESEFGQGAHFKFTLGEIKGGSDE